MESSDFAKEFLKQSVDYFDANTPRIEKCLSQLNETQIWNKPNANSNSIGNLILHLCGNIGQWILSGLGEQPDVRQRDAEFGVQGGMSKDELIFRLKAVTDEARRVMMAMNTTDLMTERDVQCYHLSGIGIIIHAVEHYSYHTGQIAYLTKVLLDKDLGFYEGLELG